MRRVVSGLSNPTRTWVTESAARASRRELAYRVEGGALPDNLRLLLDEYVGQHSSRDLLTAVGQVHTVVTELARHFSLDKKADLSEWSLPMLERVHGISAGDLNEFLAPSMLDLLSGCHVWQRRLIGSTTEAVLSARAVDLDVTRRSVPLSDAEAFPVAGPPELPTTLFLATAKRSRGPPAARCADFDRRLQEVVRDYRLHFNVELFVASPPERHVHWKRFAFLKGLIDPNAPEIERVNLARLLVPAYSFFRVWSAVYSAVYGRPAVLKHESFPVALYGLPDNFFTLTPAVRKVMTLELTPRLNWSVAALMVDHDWLPPRPNSEPPRDGD